MPDQGAPAEPAAPRLTPAEADRRKSILALLKDALSAQEITSAIVGRRTLVLCSDQNAGFAGYGETVSPSDPQLYVFAGADVHIVTTDGEAYRFPGGHAHPTADPVGAARAYARRHHGR